MSDVSEETTCFKMFISGNELICLFDWNSDLFRHPTFYKFILNVDSKTYYPARYRGLHQYCGIFSIEF
jgi:hypothetical protein